MKKTEAGTMYRAPTKAQPKTQERKKEWLRHTD